MTLEDFEKNLVQSKTERSSYRKRSRSHGRDREHRHSGQHHGDRASRHGRERDQEDGQRSKHRHKRSRKEEEPRKSTILGSAQSIGNQDVEDSEDEWVEKEEPGPVKDVQEAEHQIRGNSLKPQLKRDAWMQAPLQVEHVRSRRTRTPPPKHVQASGSDFKLMIHDNELNHHLRESKPNEQKAEEGTDLPVRHQVEYTFGDQGSSWRIMKLRNVYRQAKESGKSVEAIATEHYGDLRLFDDAREEEIEMDRRKNYGADYLGKVKPSGELFQERKLDLGIRKEDSVQEESEDGFDRFQGKIIEEKKASAVTLPLDQTALNKLKAQMMRARMKDAPDASKLEAEFNEAVAAAANSKQPDVVVLNKMESRMLASGRKGEVNSINNKRGRERGLVKENEDMSIDDMIRQERRSKGQFNDSGKAFADQIAKDGKFDNDLDYMDDNAVKLAKAVSKSDASLRNSAVADYQKMKRILDTCPLCHHEDTDTPPLAPIVSLGTRTFLTLPTSPEITPYGFCASIVPIQHRLNLLECDEDEWDEIRNFMKSIARLYYAQKPAYSVIFYENAAHEGRKRHASLEAVPLPVHIAEQAPAFFREAILSADEEWTQHKKIIDTGAKAAGGAGKLAFRRSMVSELPYFHVWFTLDGGLGHVVEDTRRWPKGDLFAREIIGGMLDVGTEVIRRQGRWKKGDVDMESRVRSFRKEWDKWDWTKALMEDDIAG